MIKFKRVTMYETDDGMKHVSAEQAELHASMKELKLLMTKNPFLGSGGVNFEEFLSWLRDNKLELESIMEVKLEGSENKLSSIVRNQ